MSFSHNCTNIQITALDHDHASSHRHIVHVCLWHHILLIKLFASVSQHVTKVAFTTNINGEIPCNALLLSWRFFKSLLLLTAGYMD